MRHIMIPADKARLCADAIRFLSVDAVEKANSGHPGLPMGAADCAFALWGNLLSFNPDDPCWPNRDRFVPQPAMVRCSSIRCSTFSGMICRWKS